jgi:hypothetical protein
VAKAVLDLKTTRALIDRLGADTKLRRLCGFDVRVALPSEATFSRMLILSHVVSLWRGSSA